MHRRNIPTTYTEAREMLNGRTSRSIANNTALVELDDEGIGLRLHATYVVTFRPDGSIVLNSGGWHTVTTKDRLNRVARAHGWSVYAKARTWYVGRRSGAEFEFEDGFTIPARGPACMDARVEDHGSVLLVRPLTQNACAWLKENTDGMWFGSALAVEPPYVLNLVAGMREHGFTVEAA
jgi:hypothetical protein